MIIQYIYIITPYPVYLFFYMNYKETSRLFFYILISGLSFYEFINKKMYYFQYNDINEYNYIGDVCRIIITQYFLTDIFFINDKTLIFHHCIFLSGLVYSYIFNQCYYLIVYLGLNEISTIFLSLKYLQILPKYTNILFIITFFIFRIILLPILTYIYINNYILFVLLMLDDCLHIYWVVTLSKSFFIK